MTDLRHLDATLDNLRAARDDIDRVLAEVTAARRQLAAASDGGRDRALRRLSAAEITMRSTAAVLAHHFSAIATPLEAVPG